MPRRAPVGNSGPIRGETLLALPLIGEPPDAAAARLTALVGRQIRHTQAAFGGGGPDERPAIAILGLTAAEAEAIGVALGLETLFFWDGRRASLIACTPAY